MTAISLLITDLTRMGRRFCIAGWDTQTRRMVRPLPPSGHSWSRAAIEEAGLQAGAMVRVYPTGRARPDSLFPHATEDCEVTAGSLRVVRPAPGLWRFAAQAPPSAPRLRDAFGTELQTEGEQAGYRRKTHIAQGIRTRSLWGISVPASRIRFHVGSMSGKLRVRLDDSETGYDLPVVCNRLRSFVEEDGVAAVNELLPARAVLHVRVGAARPMLSEPGVCYLMLNGVFW